MTIIKAISFFKILLNETNRKSEIKTYESFVNLLSDLENRSFSNIQLQSIEEKLDLLELQSNPKNNKRYFNKKLAEFKKYLNDKFSFTSEGYYTVIGMSLGVSFGIIFGTFFEKTIGVSIGLAFGMFMGLIIGKSLDAQRDKQNLVLKTKLM